jgi:hypothetical protein
MVKLAALDAAQPVALACETGLARPQLDLAWITSGLP